MIDPRDGLACERTDLAARPPGTFEVLAEVGTARAGRLWTAHGPIDTPCFMPVGTYGAVKGIAPDELEAVGSQVILGNAYHLAHRPGSALVRELGGLHEMIGWRRAILTDSGGYQVFSLRGLQRIDDDGVDYRTHFDGSAHRMTPQSVLEVQAALGSDICMVLDHCPPADASPLDLRKAVDRTTRWAERAAELRGSILGPRQLCFGIVQGGTDLALRREHAATIGALPFDGLALGGLSVGEPPAVTHATMHAIAPELPRDRPRYVMGIGMPIDLLEAVTSGIDMFDCVLPSRNARNGQLFTRMGKLNIRRAEHRSDRRPVDAACGCPSCTRFSRAYLRHLHAQDDPLFGRLATLHNLWFFHDFVGTLRRALVAGTFATTAAAVRDELAALAAVTDPE